MPLYEGLGSGGEKTAVVIDLGEAFTKGQKCYLSGPKLSLFRHLLVNPRDRRVVIIESVLCPSHFRETLTRVLFKYFEVPSVLLAPSHLMALLTLGINSAMVLDCGYRESLVLPISFLNPSSKLLGSTTPRRKSSSQRVGNSTVGTMYC
uniref:Actin related protein 10 n=1 Tax=Colobus angolensis palliatus TaxID=336983 RepID=A0A2K5I9M0_COLAP